MQGVLLVDKPKGWTSFDVVNFVRRVVAVKVGKKPKNVKVGHIGTLDPMATGLLVLLVGKDYTRQAQKLSKLPKVYEVEMTLGANSSTGDSEGQLTEISSTEPSLDQIKQALKEFTGDIMQTPPAFSAIKIDGKRAYDMARAGQEVKIEPRPVSVYENKLVGYEYPLVKFVASVSSGTYIRSLSEDMGRFLNTGAYLTGLKRTQIDRFSLEKAITIDKDDPDMAQKIADNLSELELDSWGLICYINVTWLQVRRNKQLLKARKFTLKTPAVLPLKFLLIPNVSKS